MQPDFKTLVTSLGIFAMFFVTLKIIGAAEASWWVVLMPFWGGFPVVLIGAFLLDQNKKFLYHNGPEMKYISLYGRGMCIRCTPLLFSEKEGHTPYYKLPFGWRLVFYKGL